MGTCRLQWTGQWFQECMALVASEVSIRSQNYLPLFTCCQLEAPGHFEDAEGEVSDHTENTPSLVTRRQKFPGADAPAPAASDLQPAEAVSRKRPSGCDPDGRSNSFVWLELMVVLTSPIRNRPAPHSLGSLLFLNKHKLGTTARACGHMRLRPEAPARQRRI